MQNEPHGEERRHLTEQSKFDRALSATVIVRFRFWFLCQAEPVSRSTAAVKDTYIIVTQTKKVCLRGKLIALDDMPAGSGMVAVRTIRRGGTKNKEQRNTKQ